MRDYSIYPKTSAILSGAEKKIEIMINGHRYIVKPQLPPWRSYCRTDIGNDRKFLQTKISCVKSRTISKSTKSQKPRPCSVQA